MTEVEKMTVTVDRPLTTASAARLLGVHPNTVKNWVDRGALGAYRTVGGRRRIPREAIEAFIRDRGFPPPRGERPPRVLAVDDEAAFLRSLARMIRRLRPDADVATASTGFEAGLAARAAPPDLVLLDLNMPGMDGVAVCRALKADPATAGARVVVVTGAPETPEAAEVLRAGAVEVVAKPISRERLAAILEAALPPAPGERRG